MGDFYGTGIEIWAQFGSVGITGKKIGANYEQHFRPVFMGKNFIGIFVQSMTPKGHFEIN